MDCMDYLIINCRRINMEIDMLVSIIGMELVDEAIDYCIEKRYI